MRSYLQSTSISWIVLIFSLRYRSDAAASNFTTNRTNAHPHIISISNLSVPLLLIRRLRSTILNSFILFYRNTYDPFCSIKINITN